MVVLDIGSEILSNDEKKIYFSEFPQESRCLYPSSSACTGHQCLGSNILQPLPPGDLGEPAKVKSYVDSTPF